MESPKVSIFFASSAFSVDVTSFVVFSTANIILSSMNSATSSLSFWICLIIIASISCFVVLITSYKINAFAMRAAEEYLRKRRPQLVPHLCLGRDTLFLKCTPCSIMETGYWNFPDGEHFASSSSLYTQNIREQTLISQHCVYDAVTTIGGINNLNTSKSLIHAARNTHIRFKEAARLYEKENIEKSWKATEKRRTSIEIKKLEEKCRKIVEDAQKASAVIEDEIKALK
uniref:Uncharacterized protein n=1 Tax=Timema poppense TaxID=170557 RepID=A0A7R9CZN6_TIMPO|nr:unnamed protein product [Timema poppensis]